MEFKFTHAEHYGLAVHLLHCLAISSFALVMTAHRLAVTTQYSIEVVEKVTEEAFGAWAHVPGQRKWRPNQ